MIFGADYYPEQWEEKDWEEDMEIMKGMGLSSVRLAEFAWALMEPEQGVYDFSLFDKVLEKVQKAGMSAVLGTPTATFPPWLYKKHPEIAQTSKSGIHRGIGTRRQGCFSSEEYLEASEAFVTEMAIHFGNHPAVIGWQIDNEPGHEGSDQSYTKADLKQFRKWLKKKYSDITSLNHAWGNIFWGVLYRDFNEIPLPGLHASSDFNPTMIQDFYRFQSDALVHFISMQAKILREHSPGRFLTTNLFPSPFLAVTDMYDLAKCLDFISWDNYPVWGPQKEPFPHQFVAATLQYARGLLNKPFTVMEQFSGVQGHNLLGYLPPPGQISLWLAQAVLHGADKIYFFRYRTARFGQEQLCYGILDHSKELTSKYNELKDGIKFLREYAEDFCQEEYPADVLILHDIENARLLKHQPLSEGLQFDPAPFASVGYDIEIATWYSGFSALNVPVHFRPIKTDIDFSKYKMIVLPLYWITDSAIISRLENFVKLGGTLVLGYRSGTKDQNLWMYDQTPPGPFGKLAGVAVRNFECPGNEKVGLRFGLWRGSCSKVCEIVEPITAKVIGRYKDKKKFYSGKPAITVNPYGKGKTYYIGTSLSPESFVLFWWKHLKKSKIRTNFKGKNIEIIQRVGKKFQYEAFLNHSNKTTWSGFKRLKPFEVRITRKSR